MKEVFLLHEGQNTSATISGSIKRDNSEENGSVYSTSDKGPIREYKYNMDQFGRIGKEELGDIFYM